jgi:RNA polymerase sigma factor (sigma-70 family)
LARLGVDAKRLSDVELARVEELASLGDLRELVGGALRTLSAEQREVLELRIVRELDHPQIARRLGISEPPARARVSRGLRGLAAALDATEGAA